MRFPLPLEHKQIRGELAGDEVAIRNVVSEVFGRVQEAGLVDALRRNGDLLVPTAATWKRTLRGRSVGTRGWLRRGRTELALSFSRCRRSAPFRMRADRR